MAFLPDKRGTQENPTKAEVRSRCGRPRTDAERGRRPGGVRIGSFKAEPPFGAAVLRARTAQNVAINVALQWTNRFLSVVTKVVLVRLLFPNDFGIFALATGLIGFVGTFGNFGLDYAIIQKAHAATDEDYDVAMTMRIVIAVGLFVASIIAAGPWADLYASPVVAPTTEVLALAYLFGIWSFVPATRLTSELRYRALAIPNLAGQITNSAVSITLAFLGFGVWALVYGTIVSALVGTIGYTIMRRWRFRLRFRRSVARPLLGYAQHLISAAVLAFLITNIDNFTVGYFWGEVWLGYYAVAYGYGYLPVSLFSSPAGGALFPSFTKVQDDVDALRRGYLESYGYAMALIVPAAVGMAMMSPEIVDILFGPIWSPAILPLLILSFYGLFRAQIDFSSSLFGAVGKPRIIAELNLYVLLLSVVPLFVLTYYFKIVGTSVAMTVPVAIVAVLSISKSARILQARWREILGRLRGPLLASEAMAVVVFGLRTLLYEALPTRVPFPFAENGISAYTIVLLVGIAVGIGVYFAVLALIDRETFAGMRHTITMMLRRRHE